MAGMKLALAALVLTGAVQSAGDPVEKVADALWRGEAAPRDPHKLLAAADALDALGARPAEGSADAAADWRTQARRRGVRSNGDLFRGRTLGPAYRSGTLAPGASFATEQSFLAGQKAMIAIVPAPDRTLTMQVRTPEKPICAGGVSAPRAVCSWLPVFTTRVEIRITNTGKAPARYYLVSN